MAQSNPAIAESKPTLVSVESTPAKAKDRPEKSSRRILWILGAVILALGAYAYWQSQQLTQAQGRIGVLEDRVVGLESQLSVANGQLQTYEMQRGLVREAVSDISERMIALSEMVGATPAVGARPQVSVPAEAPTPAEAPQP